MLRRLRSRWPFSRSRASDLVAGALTALLVGLGGNALAVQQTGSGVIPITPPFHGGGAITSPLFAPVSTCAAPGYGFTGAQTTGVAGTVTPTLLLCVGGTTVGSLTTTSLTVAAGTIITAGTINPGSTGSISFGPHALVTGAGADGAIKVTNNAANATLNLSLGAAANGQAVNLINTLTELTTIAAAATTDTTIQMPANSVVLGVSVRVTVIIPTAATFTVGDSGSAARFSTAAVAVAAGSTDSGVKAGAYYNAGALSIRITPNATPVNNSGRVRVTIYYYTVTPPTS